MYSPDRRSLHSTSSRCSHGAARWTPRWSAALRFAAPTFGSTELHPAPMLPHHKRTPMSSVIRYFWPAAFIVKGSMLANSYEIPRVTISSQLQTVPASPRAIWKKCYQPLLSIVLVVIHIAGSAARTARPPAPPPLTGIDF